MKTTRITVGAFAIAFVVMMCGYITLANVEESVVVKEEVLAGDVKAVEGMTLHYMNQMANQHYWAIDVPLGNADTTSVEYTYYSEEHYLDQEVEERIELSTITSGGMTFSESVIEEMMEELTPENYQGWPISMISDVISRTEEGTNNSETLLYSDYYEYYPMQAYISLSKAVTLKAEEQLNEYFQFPVNEGHALTITVDYKDVEYTGLNIEVESVAEDENREMYIESASVVEEEGVYLALQQTWYDYYEGESTPVGNTELYYIPFANIVDNVIEEFGEIQKVATLPDMTQVRCMGSSENEITAVIEEDGETFFVVYDKTNFQEQQRIEIGDTTYYTVIMEDAIYLEGEDSRYTVITSANGEYSIALEGVLEYVTPEVEDEYYYEYFHYEYIQDKLIILKGIGDYIILYCYDTDGLAYAGSYRDSQADEYQMEEDYLLNIFCTTEWDIY